MQRNRYARERERERKKQREREKQREIDQIQNNRWNETDTKNKEIDKKSCLREKERQTER
jgi:hypothetical protein